LDAILLGDQPQIRIFIIPPGKMNAASRSLWHADDAKKLFTRYNVRPTFLDRVCSAQNLELEIERNYEYKDTVCSEIGRFGKFSYIAIVENTSDTYFLDSDFQYSLAIPGGWHLLIYVHYNCTSNVQVVFSFILGAHPLRFSSFMEELSNNLSHALALPNHTQSLYLNPIILQLLLFGFITDAWKDDVHMFCNYVNSQVSHFFRTVYISS
jgi:hypothetical protein